MGLAAEDRRQQILEGAFTCFAAKGYHNTTMDDIVAACGLSKGALYWYFKSKKELLLAVVDAWLEAADDAYHAAAARAGTPRDKLRAMGRVYGQALAADARRAAVAIEFWGLSGQDPEVRERLRQLYGRYRGMVEGILAEGVAAGQFRPLDARRIAGVLLAAYDGLCLQWWLDPAAVDWPEVADAVLDLLPEGGA